MKRIRFSVRTVLVATVILLLAILVAYSIRSMRPSRRQLLNAAKGADRIVVVAGGVGGTPEDERDFGKPVFEIRGAEQVRELLDQVEWSDPESPFVNSRCMCDGEYHLDLYRGEKLAVSLGFHHDYSIRWRNGPWNTDVMLTDSSREALPQWFKEHGFEGLWRVRERYLSMEKSDRTNRFVMPLPSQALRSVADPPQVPPDEHRPRQ